MNQETVLDKKLYTELELISWDRKEQFLGERDVFQLYESCWRYVDSHKLSVTERELVDRLTEKFGNGCFLAS